MNLKNYLHKNPKLKKRIHRFIMHPVKTRPYWWLLVVSENLPLFGYSTAYKPITYKILFRETNPRRDKNGTEPQENKIKNALLRISASEYLLLRCKGTNLSRQKRIKTHKVHIYSAFFIFLYHDG